ncbi:MAG: MBL fold metallo-hydrolase, partial [Chloroflexi bacterium]|nr:MBL fold metallo-hydrolase [Chloroflexota bacterium]
LPKNEKKILKYIEEIGRKPNDLKRILLTHADGDHVGSAKALRELTGAKIYASEYEAECAAKGMPPREPKLSNPLLKLLFSLTAKMFVYPPTTVDQIVKDGDVLPVLGGLRVISTPGHTPEHVSYFSPSHNILLAGDSLRTSKDQIYNAVSPFTWDEAKQNQSVKLQADLKPQIVCVGHGDVVREAAHKFKFTKVKSD